MKTKVIKLDLSIAADARKYIKYFNEKNKKALPGGVEVVRLSSGREIRFSSMTDEDAIIAANGLAEMDHQAQKNSKLN